MNFKNLNAEKTTITRDVVYLEEKTGNIYKSIVVVSKRANQISTTLKEELTQKLQEFNVSTDNLEEVFENREQIELSRHYEKMPKAPAIAIEEMLDDKLFIRNIEEQED